MTDNSNRKLVYIPDHPWLGFGMVTGWSREGSGPRLLYVYWQDDRTFIYSEDDPRIRIVDDPRQGGEKP